MFAYEHTKLKKYKTGDNRKSNTLFIIAANTVV